MLEKNLKNLKKRDAELYKKVKVHKLSDKYEVVNSKNGMKNLIIEEKRYLHSRYNPDREAEQWVNGINICDEDSILVTGLGLGYYLEKLIKKYPDKKIFIVEPDLDIFIRALSQIDFENFFNNGNVIFLVDLNIDAICVILSDYIYYGAINNIYFAELPAYKIEYKDFIEDLYSSIHRSIYDLRGNIATQLYFANLWIYNTIRNLKGLTDDLSAKVFKGLCRDIPVVIVSAGPSLEKNIKLLKQLYDKALILAVGSAVNILENNDIIPHMIMGIDGGEGESKIFNSMKNQEPVFIYGPTVNYKSTQKYRGKKAWIGLDIQSYIFPVLDRYTKEYCVINSGPSVANVALDFSYRVLKANTIIFIGQDLAYTGEKLYSEGHAHGDINNEKRDYSNNSYVLTEDIYGNNIYTKKTFLNMRNWFEDYVRINNIKDGIYNCTEGGINIHGIPNMKIKEAIEKYCKKAIDIKQLIVERMKEQSVDDIISFNEILEESEKSIENCIGLSENRLELLGDLLDDILKENKNVDFSNRFNKIISISEKIEKESAYNYFVYPLIKSYLDLTTFNANRMAKETCDTDKAKIETLNILSNQYLVIDNGLKVALKAFKGE